MSKLVSSPCRFSCGVFLVLDSCISLLVEDNVSFANLEHIFDLTGIIRYGELVFAVHFPAAPAFHVGVFLPVGIIYSPCELLKFSNDVIPVMVPLLRVQRILHSPVELLRAEGLQYPVSGFQVLDFVQLGEVRQGCTALFGFLEAVVVQFQQLDTPPNGGL